MQQQFAAGSAVFEQTATFLSLSVYRDRVLKSISKLKQAVSNPPASADGQPGQLDKELQCNERALTAVNEGLQQHAALLKRARDYTLTFKQ